MDSTAENDSTSQASPDAICSELPESSMQSRMRPVQRENKLIANDKERNKRMKQLGRIHRQLKEQTACEVLTLVLGIDPPTGEI